MLVVRCPVFLACVGATTISFDERQVLSTETMTTRRVSVRPFLYGAREVITFRDSVRAVGKMVNCNVVERWNWVGSVLFILPRDVS